MQYALIEIAKNHLHLIDANEIRILDEDEKNISETEFNEKEAKYIVAYGAFLPSHVSRIDKSLALQLLKDYQDYFFGYINKNNKCVLFGIKEFFGFSDVIVRGQSYIAPFACLLEVDEKFSLCSGAFARSAFLRASNLSIQDNILNRQGIFAISQEEKQKTKNQEITLENWKDFISLERINKVALKIK